MLEPLTARVIRTRATGMQKRSLLLSFWLGLLLSCRAEVDNGFTNDSNLITEPERLFRLRRDFLQPANDLDVPATHDLHVYGTIRHIVSGATVPVCEGVLLSSRLVLTLSNCLYDQANQLGNPSDLAFSYRGNIYVVHNYIVRANWPYAVILLGQGVSPTPSVYAFPSWTGEWQTTDKNWLILPEQVRMHSYRLSSYYAAALGLADETPRVNDINAVLDSCDFEDKADMFALNCKGPYKNFLQNFVPDGASFFRQISDGPVKAVAVPALVMRGESFSKCSGSKSHQELSFLRLPKRSSASQGAYVCGLRFKYTYVQVILNDAKVLHEAITDQDVIPNGRKFGTMNINGIKRFTRPFGAQVMETLVSIVKETDIMAIQEISEVNPVDAALRPHGYAKVALSPGKEFKSATLFYYKASEIDSEGCEEIFNYKMYGLYCRFRYKQRGGQAQQCIHFFTVHLTEGNQTRRHNQIKDLKSRIDSLDPNLGCKTVLIGGDFNIGASKLSIPKTREDAHFTIRTLSNMRFYDTGDTTEKDGDDKKESHYDHILVSDNTRLLHQYYPLVPPGERASKVYSTYIPISTQFRNTEPKIRSYDLSDHLPLRFQDSDTGAFVGTWNLRNFQVLSTGNPGRKEGLHKEIYEEVFAQFHILALQELSGTASNLYNKALIVSPTPNKETNELGIAYDPSVLQVINCLDLPVSDPPGTPKPNKYRAMFGCTFQTANLERITVFSVHVKNENSKIKTSKLYRAHADEFARANPSSGTGTGVGNVYLVGDFNADKPSGSKECFHRDNGGISPRLEYTLITSKYIRDYVWHSENLLPGISGCQVLNPELMRDSSGRYIIDDLPHAISGSGMRVFATWKEISDHLPMIVEFKTE